MSTVDRPRTPEAGARRSLFDDDGLPWLENGAAMSQREFHERYAMTPDGFRAELIGGIVYVVASPLSIRHGRGDASASGWLFTYSVDTPGTVVQNNATTILGEASEPQPDSALLIREDHGGQSRDGDGPVAYTHGAPELIVEVAFTTQSIDFRAKLRDYEAAGVLEYLVLNLKTRTAHWFHLRDGRFEPIAPDADGLHRSATFPGLWLDADALFADDKRRLIAALRRGLDTPEHAAFVAELERRKAARDAAN